MGRASCSKASYSNTINGATETSTATEAPARSAACTLPTDLLLEIIARSDPSTLIRCAAASKLLRHDILGQSFIRHVTRRKHGIMPGRLLAYIHTHKGEEAPPPPPLSLVNPATPAAASFLEHHLCPFMSRNKVDLLAEYQPVTSCGGLVLLLRRSINWVRKPGQRPDCLCVYDPMTGDQTFLPRSPEIAGMPLFLTYVLLNAADGIGCAFKLLVVDVHYHQHMGCEIRVQAATSSDTGGGSWGPVTFDRHIDLPSLAKQDQRCTVIFHEGFIHFCWLNRYNDEILTYDVQKERLDTVKLPSTNSKASHRRLQRSWDGKLLLFTADGFVISVWLLQLQGSGWRQEAVIDTKENLRLLLHPVIHLDHVEIKFEELTRGERSSAVLLRICFCDKDLLGALVVLDLETKEIRRTSRQNWMSSMLLEIDLLYRLQAMKTFS